MTRKRKMKSLITEVKDEKPFKPPLGFYACLLILLLILTCIWDKVESQNYKTILKYLGTIFFFATLRGALAIRLGTFDKKRTHSTPYGTLRLQVLFLCDIFVIGAFNSRTQETRNNFKMGNGKQFIIHYHLLRIGHGIYSQSRIFFSGNF